MFTAFTLELRSIASCWWILQVSVIIQQRRAVSAVLMWKDLRSVLLLYSRECLVRIYSAPTVSETADCASSSTSSSSSARLYRPLLYDFTSTATLSPTSK